MPHNRYLANRSPSGVKLLAIVLVPLFPADVRLVNLNRASKLLSIGGPHLSYPVRHVPCGALGYAKVSVKLHAGHALEVRSVQEKRYRPLTQGQVGAMEQGSRLYGEGLAAFLFPAAEGLRLAAGDGGDVERTAEGAGNAGGPTLLEEPRLRLLFGVELLDRIHQGDSFAVGLSGAALTDHSPHLASLAL